MKKITLFIVLLFTAIFINAQCNEPSDVELTYQSELTIHWEANGASDWDLEFGEQGFTPTGTPLVENRPYPYYFGFDDFENTYLDFYVRADCGAETSEWVGPFTFYNYCYVVSWGESINENFDAGSIPACYIQSNEGASDTGVGIYGESEWEIATFANEAGGSSAAKVTISGDTTNEWLILPPMRGAGLIAKSYWTLELIFNMSLTQSGSTELATLGSDDVVKLVISPDLGETWFTIDTWDADNTIPNDGGSFYYMYENESDGFDIYETTFLVAFWVSSGSVSDVGVDLFLDNIYAEPPYIGAINDLNNKDFKYYPNPSTNSINISAKEKITKVVLYNQLGQELLQSSVNTLQSQLDISELPKGVFFMKVQIGDTNGIVSLVKE